MTARYSSRMDTFIVAISFAMEMIAFTQSLI